MIKRRKGNYLMKVGSINATEEEKGRVILPLQ
jgi:hypothetical protein